MVIKEKETIRNCHELANIDLDSTNFWLRSFIFGERRGKIKTHFVASKKIVFFEVLTKAGDWWDTTHFGWGIWLLPPG